MAPRARSAVYGNATTVLILLTWAIAMVATVLSASRSSNIDIAHGSLSYDRSHPSGNLLSSASRFGLAASPQEQGVAELPRLKVAVAGRWSEFVGESQVYGVLDAEGARIASIIVAWSMLCCLLAFAVVSFYYRPEVAKWALWCGLLAIPASAAVYESCPSCSSFGRLALESSPLLAVLAVGASWLALSAQLSRKATLGVLIVGIAVWLGQLALVVSSPKFCLACLTLGMANCALMALASSRLDSEEFLAVRLPRGMLGTGKVALLAAFGLQSVYALGLASPHVGQTLYVPNLTGRNLGAYVSDVSSVPSGVVVVTRNGCGACERARAALEASGIAFREIPVSAYTTRGIVFDESKFDILTPLVMVVDGNHKIDLAQEGWPRSADQQSSLLSTLASRQNK